MSGIIITEDECNAIYGNGENLFRLAAASPGELGLIEALAGAFNAQHSATLCWIKAGSGKSLDLLREKKVDMTIVHAPAAEKQAVKDGWAINRTLLASNEFYIVGPADDPAGIAEARSAADAYARIANAGAKFLSRGDNSGTHKKEMKIWENAGITPSGNWYIVTRDFMMATLRKADETGGYFMVDSSSWVAGKKDTPRLAILFRGDPVLINTYHALCQPEGATSGQSIAAKFIDFTASGAGQQIIRDYGKDRFGEAMYNDAQYASQYGY